MQGPISFIPGGMSYATRMALQPLTSKNQSLTSKKTTDSDGSCGQNISDHSLLPNPQ